MRVEIRHPTGWLKPYVDNVWRVSGFRDEDPDLRGWILPEPGFNVVFNLGSAHHLFADAWVEVHRRSWIAGERTRPVAIAVAGESNYVGVRFQPGAGNLFLGIGAAGLTDQAVDLEPFWGALAETTRERLHHARTMEEVTEVIVAALRARFDERVAPPRALAAAVAALRATPPGLSIRNLAQDIGVSHSTLLRQFDHWVGLRPKLMHRLFRFERALEVEALSDHPRWTDIAHDAGYYDQAHLVHEFREFARMRPAAYRSARCPMPAAVTIDAEGNRRTLERFRRGVAVVSADTIG